MSSKDLIDLSLVNPAPPPDPYRRPVDHGRLSTYACPRITVCIQVHKWRLQRRPVCKGFVRSYQGHRGRGRHDGAKGSPASHPPCAYWQRNVKQTTLNGLVNVYVFGGCVQRFVSSLPSDGTKSPCLIVLSSTTGSYPATGA